MPLPYPMETRKRAPEYARLPSHVTASSQAHGLEETSRVGGPTLLRAWHANRNHLISKNVDLLIKSLA
ncbi:MAG: hypothetical protein JSS02_07900 [Planctomycetes bacterium]|nr:hypothetical protein [Planctomycetota bacterium]